MDYIVVISANTLITKKKQKIDYFMVIISKFEIAKFSASFPTMLYTCSCRRPHGDQLHWLMPRSVSWPMLCWIFPMSALFCCLRVAFQCSIFLLSTNTSSTLPTALSSRTMRTHREAVGVTVGAWRPRSCCISGGKAQSGLS